MELRGSQSCFLPRTLPLEAPGHGNDWRGDLFSQPISTGLESVSVDHDWPGDGGLLFVWHAGIGLGSRESW